MEIFLETHYFYIEVFKISSGTTKDSPTVGSQCCLYSDWGVPVGWLWPGGIVGHWTVDALRPQDGHLLAEGGMQHADQN